MMNSLENPVTDATVLVVEDSATQRELVRHILEEHGYFTTGVSSANEALASVARQMPTIILSDIIMPGVNGFDLCRRLKSNVRFSDIPVVLLTSLNDPKDVIQGLECGADGFIVKPFDETYLLARVDYILTNRKLRQAGDSGGVEIEFDGKRYFITSERRQILDLLLSTYEAAVRKNAELLKLQQELKGVNAQLESRVRERTAELNEANDDLRHEVNERKRAESALRESVAELETFSYSLSHDMRAPLRAMTSFAEILASEHSQQLGDEAKRYLGKIIAAASRLDRLIQDVLTYNKLLRTQIVLEPVDLNLLVEQIVHERPNLNPAQIRIEAPLLKVKAHPAALTQCLTNLLDNAAKFVRAGQQPEIRIRTELIDNKVRLWIEDKGIGIPLQVQERIFGLFERGHAEGTHTGTGVGLAIVRKAVQRMGGRLGLESELNRGTKFWIELDAA